MLSSLLLSNTLKVNKRANFWFGLFLLFWSTYWLEEILLLIGAKLDTTSIYFVIIKSIQFLTPMLFFNSTRLFSNPDYHYKKEEYLYFILPIVYGFLFYQSIIFPRAENYKLLVLILTLVNAITLLSFAIVTIERHKKKVRLYYSDIEDVDLSWLEYILAALLALVLFISVYNILFPYAELNSLANGFMFVIILFIGHFVIRQEEIFMIAKEERTQIEEVSLSDNKIIDDDELNEIMVNLRRQMEEKELFLDKKLTLKKLSGIANTTPHKLSYALNAGFNQTFYQFVNEYRVERAKLLLDGPKKNEYTILAIAYESGFNSKSTFNTSFKKVTGITPSQYINS